MRLLELFCGTKSVGKVFRAAGYEVCSVDLDPQHSPDIVADVLKLGHGDLPWRPDVIWASPPCTTFSVASMGHHWTGGKGAYIPRTPAAVTGLALMNRTTRLIAELAPAVWFIENPRGLMRKLITPPVDGRRVTVTYCQYGDKRMKPTDIWTNTNWIPRPMCRNGSPCHEAAPRGAKTGTQGLRGAVARGVIPEALCREVLAVCEAAGLGVLKGLV